MESSTSWLDSTKLGIRYVPFSFMHSFARSFIHSSPINSCFFFAAFVCSHWPNSGSIQLILGAFIFLIGIVTAYKFISQNIWVYGVCWCQKKKQISVEQSRLPVRQISLSLDSPLLLYFHFKRKRMEICLIRFLLRTTSERVPPSTPVDWSCRAKCRKSGDGVQLSIILSRPSRPVKGLEVGFTSILISVPQ